MIEKKYKVRRVSLKEEAAIVTLPPDWRRYHKVEFGDTVKMLANGIVVILPPNTSEEKEEEIREFLEGNT